MKQDRREATHCCSALGRVIQVTDIALTTFKLDTTSTRMRAAVYRKFGPSSVIHTETLPVPGRKAGEVLIKVAATSVNPIGEYACPSTC